MRDDSNDTYIQGMKTRRAVLGEAHVDSAEASKTDFDAPFQQLIVEAAWGHVWSGAGLTPRERSLITLALLAGLGHDEEFSMPSAPHRGLFLQQDHPICQRPSF